MEEGEDKGLDWEPEEDERDRPHLVSPHTLPDALRQLTLFGDDPYLSMQATNLGIVDTFCMQLESDLLRLYAQQERTPPEGVFVSAQSQMWIFAAYEALRTWRQRAKDV